MRHYSTTTMVLPLWCVLACSTAIFAQELVPPPAPSNVGRAVGEASSIATQSLAAGTSAVNAAPTATPVGTGFRPGGFFHALSTTKTNVCLKLKQSPLGALIAEMRKPLSTITGGIVPSTAAPSKAEIAAAGPQGTAAQIQAIKVDAPKRVAAVQQLKGLDVRYHPEAAQTLIAALRADPSDCVRLEAARTIAGLRTCTKPIAEALRVCVEGAETDGNPAELSPAVKRQAAIALSCCLNCLSDSQADVLPEPRPEYPVTQASLTAAVDSKGQTVVQAQLNANSSQYYKQVANAPRDLVSQVAHQTLEKHRNLLVDPLQGTFSGRANGQQSTTGNQSGVANVTPSGLLEIWRASRK